MGKKGILRLLLAPLVPWNKFLPKNKRLILIYSNLGFRDNARAFYDYLTENGYNSKYKIVCSSNDYKHWKKTAPENVKFVSGKRALFTFLRCSCMLYSFGKFPIKPAKGQTVINLWHGMPLKAIASLEKGVSFDGRCYFNYTIATSPFFSEVMQRCFEVGEDKVLLTGQPRCDKLFLRDVHCKKLILWLPTYRSSHSLGSYNAEVENSTGFPLIDTEEQLYELDDLLGELGYKLLIKPHPMQDITKGAKSLTNIMLTTERALERQNMDIYDLMKRSQALITDYSSACFDYLLLNRQIGFTVSDIDRYSDERGFVVDEPEELMPGEKLRSFNELKSFIINVIRKNDSWKGERRRVNALVNSHQKGDACKQIIDIIGLSL